MSLRETDLSSARTLSHLTAGLVHVGTDMAISDITLDSRAVTPGALFLACRGQAHHGLQFAPQAVARGARAVLYEGTADGADPRPELGSKIFVAAVPGLRHHVGTIADRFFGAPSQSLTVAGITGTNGKTTCAWLLAQALQACNRPAAYMGTLGFGVPPAVTATQHTTPDAVSVHRQLATLRGLGAECVSMEVSSHAIDQERVAAVRFETAAFTNLTHDHLDYHGTMDAYGAAKAQLLSWPSLAHRIINIDDPFGTQLAQQRSTGRLVVTTRQRNARLAAITSPQFVLATHVVAATSGLHITIESSWGGSEFGVPLIGDFNVDNVLTVLAVLLAWEVPLERAAAALARCTPPSGRMETFGGTGGAPLAIVDYAHTPDALGKALRAARQHCKGKLRVVFGCGGDRDASKRPVMARVASELADEVIVTDDNPRTEDPARIVADIVTGLHGGPKPLIEHDRALAIRIALRRSAADDVVLVAGKGHEDYQIYGDVRRPFRDQAIVSGVLGGAVQ
jgi:UDP-N-acetylmuramoyl-L-alanyl-D-glutamate--2,6-diaminopimelate ligase